MGENTTEKSDSKICVGLLAHVDAGKTTLAEALLYHAGVIRKTGRVDHQDAYLDTDAMEKRRGITITANAVRVGQATGKELNFDMKRAILDARSAGDSVGSELECVVTGVPAGVGGLLFGGMESRIAGMLYAIPGVKGVEFGRGFALAEMRGSEANDPIRLKNGRITMASNNAGGINGGITNGMPLVVRMALRPTPSIACEQPSVDLTTMEETPLRINGRHDPCLAPRAIPVMEAALACCVLDAMLDTAATI